MLSVVTSLYYSSEYVPEFIERCLATFEDLGIKDVEFIFVNDGDTDDSVDLIRRNYIDTDQAKIKLVELSRNFGHHKALVTGLRFAEGDLVYMIDVDLEESPEMIKSFFEVMNKDKSLDVVYGVQKTRKGNLFERLSGRAFYKLFDILADIQYPHDTTSARLMRRRYVDAILQYPEKELELWGVFVLAGFNQLGVEVIKTSKGKTTYSLKKKLNMAVQTITSFSNKPLFLIFVTGLIIFGMSCLGFVYIVIQKVIYGDEIAGWASVVGSIWLIGGVIMSSIGVVGIYLSKIFLEVKNRPLVHIKSVYQSSKNKE